MTDQVHSFVENGVGRIRLNRPRAIHALTPEMCVAINPALMRWSEDDAVIAVVIDHITPLSVDQEWTPLSQAKRLKSCSTSQRSLPAV